MAMKKKYFHNKAERNHQLKPSRTCLSDNQEQCYREETSQPSIISLMLEHGSADHKQTVKTNPGIDCNLNRNNMFSSPKVKKATSKHISDGRNDVTKMESPARMLIATNQRCPPVASKNSSRVNSCSESENCLNSVPVGNSSAIGQVDAARILTMTSAAENQMQKIQSAPKVECTAGVQVSDPHDTQPANDPASDAGSEVSHPSISSGQQPACVEKSASSMRQMKALKSQQKNVSDLLGQEADEVATLKKKLQDQLLLKSVLEKEVIKLRQKASKSAQVNRVGPVNRLETTGNVTLPPSEPCSPVTISVQRPDKSPLPGAQPNAGLSPNRFSIPTTYIPRTVQPKSFTPTGEHHVVVRPRNDHVIRFQHLTMALHRSTEERGSAQMQSVELQIEASQHQNEMKDLKDEQVSPGEKLRNLAEESSRNAREEIRLGWCEEEVRTIDNGNNGLTEARVEGCVIRNELSGHGEPGSTESMDADFPPLSNHIFPSSSNGANCSGSAASSMCRDSVAVSAAYQTMNGCVQSMETRVTDVPFTAQSLCWTDASSIHQNQDNFGPTPACLHGPESENFVAQSYISYAANPVCAGKKRYSFSHGAHGHRTVLQRIPELEEVSSDRETGSSHVSDTSEDESTDETSDGSESHEDRLGELEGEVARLEEEKRAAVERADELDEVVTRLDTELKAVMIECEQIQQESNIHHDLRLENTALRRDLFQAEKTVEDFKTQIEISNSENEKLRTRLDDDHRRLARLTTKMELFEANVDECISSGLQSRLQDAERSRQEALGLAERAMVELRSCCERVTQMERELTSLRANNNVRCGAVAERASDIESESALPGCSEGLYHQPSSHLGVGPASSRPASDVSWHRNQGGDTLRGGEPLVGNAASNLKTEDIDPVYSTSITNLRAEVSPQRFFCKADAQAQADDMAICKSPSYLLVNCSPATSDSGVYVDAPTGTLADARSADVAAPNNEGSAPGESGSVGNVSVLGREENAGETGEIRHHLRAALAAADRALVRGDTSLSGTRSSFSNDSPIWIQDLISPNEDPAQLKQQVASLTSSLARIQCRLAEEQLGRSETSSQRIARYTEQEVLRLVKESEQLRDEVAALQLGLITERGWVAEGELLRAQAKNEALERRVLELEELEIRMKKIMQQEAEILRWSQKPKTMEKGKESGYAAGFSNTKPVADVHVSNNVELVVESVSTQTERGTCWEPDTHTGIRGETELLERAVAAETARAALSAELDSVKVELSQARDLLRQWNDYYQYYADVQASYHRDNCSRVERSGVHVSELHLPVDTPTAKTVQEAASHQVAEWCDVNARAVPASNILTEASRVILGVPEPEHFGMPPQAPLAVEEQVSVNCTDDCDRALENHVPLDASCHDSSSLDASCHGSSHQAGKMAISSGSQQFTNVWEQIRETHAQEPQRLPPPAPGEAECSLPGSNVHPRLCPPELFTSPTEESFLRTSDTHTIRPEIGLPLDLLGTECPPFSTAAPTQVLSVLQTSSLGHDNKENETDESRLCDTTGDP